VIQVPAVISFLIKFVSWKPITQTFKPSWRIFRLSMVSSMRIVIH